MNAEIIAVGSELLLGQIVNTNAQFISQHLAQIGVNVYYHTVVGDNPERLKLAVEVAQKRATLLIFTGGLGPTKDDLTKETIAQMMGKPLVFEEKALASIEAYYKQTGRTMTENNRKQALVIEGSTILNNHHGMAPGMLVESGGLTYILLPGPPSEMQPMFACEALPYLAGQSHEQIVSRVLRFFGIGESALETEIMDLIDQQSNPTIAPLAKEGEVTLRLTAKHTNTVHAEHMIDEVEKLILNRVGEFFYGYGETELPEVAFHQLKNQRKTIACAESLTGGLFSQSLTHYSGASNVLKGSIVCYTNDAKETLLGISPQLLSEDGAVSEACAKAMAKSIREKLNSDIGISFTGVAGPTESEGKAVGTVFIGLATAEGTTCTSLRLSGSREAIRHRTMMHGYRIILKHGEALGKS